MRKIFFFITIILLSYASVQTKAQINTWKAYLAYSDITDIIQTEDITYILVSGTLCAYNNKDQQVTTYNKTNILNDCNIKHIEWNKTCKKLIIVYSNFNIDLLDKNEHVENIPEYMLKAMTEDKTINHVYAYREYAYIATNFGIIKINVKKAEITDDYLLNMKVDYTHIENNNIYAEVKYKGKYTAKLTDNLKNKNTWKKVGPYKPYKKNIDKNLLQKIKNILPIGPTYNHFAYITFQHNILYTVGGYYKAGVTESNMKGTIQVWNGKTWQLYPQNIKETTKYNYQDINTIAPDPKNPKHVFAAGKCGLYEFYDAKLVKYYNKDNSPLQSAWVNNKELGNDYVIINGITFDNKQNLWILNSLTKHNIIFKLDQQGKLTPSDKTILREGQAPAILNSPIIDQQGKLWFANEQYEYPAIICYDIEKDKLYVIDKLINQDNNTMNTAGIKCIAIDINQDLWIGTNKGLLKLDADIVKNPTENLIITQPKVPRNDGTNLADYLLDQTSITAIAIDGGGRKWIGTANDGLYLIAQDNTTELKHFKTSNSKILSDNIQSIAINNNTGEVFIATDNGLCSLITDALKPQKQLNQDNVYAYPNPVTPHYSGPISVVGLTYNADIKILTTNGVLVKQGKSNGGIFTWDATDNKGNPVAAGIYLVHATTQNADKGVVCKIAIIK